MAEVSTPVRGHVTIEKNRKSLKLQQLLSFLTTALGVVLIVIGAQSSQAEGVHQSTINGVLTTLGGLVWLASVKVLMWWHHG